MVILPERGEQQGKLSKAAGMMAASDKLLLRSPALHLSGCGAALLPCAPRIIASTVHIVIEVKEQVEVPAPTRAVWEILSNPHAVVDCVPGAALGEQHEDGSFNATLMVKFGPAKVTFRARVAVAFDEAALTGHVTSKGKDNQGGTRFSATMGFRVVETPDGAGSAVPIEAEVDIGGRLASLVEGGAALVVKRMTRDFSERLAARCLRPGEP